MGMIPEGETEQVTTPPLRVVVSTKERLKRNFSDSEIVRGARNLIKLYCNKYGIYEIFNDNIVVFLVFVSLFDTMTSSMYTCEWHQWNPLNLQREGEDVHPWPLWNVFYGPNKAPSNDLWLVFARWQFLRVLIFISIWKSKSYLTSFILLTFCESHYGMVSKILIISPFLREPIPFDCYFSNGWKPPSRLCHGKKPDSIMRSFELGSIRPVDKFTTWALWRCCYVPWQPRSTKTPWEVGRCETWNWKR